jgi:hypothetical protein
MRRFALFVIAACVLVLLLLPATALAAPSASDLAPILFSTSAKGGFGDFQNAYPWSMAAYKGDLYVGTGRYVDTSAVMALMGGAMGGMMGGGFTLPGGTAPPPLTAFVEQTSGGPVVTNPAKYAQWRQVSAAQIWRLHNGKWTKVYTSTFSPALLKDKATGLYSYDAADFMGFRNMVAYTDKYGHQALYAAAGGFSFAANAPLLLKFDGTHWTKLTTPPGMGRETRALGVHNGKLYVGAGGGKTSMFPVDAAVWCSNNPSDPSSWKQVLNLKNVDSSNTAITSFATFNNKLYVGTENATGFQVWRSTVASPAQDSNWLRVVTGGAGDPVNAWAGTMKVFKGKLYLGSMSVPGVTGSMKVKGFDLIRIDSADKWDLIVGDTRTYNGTTKKALGLWPSGFGNPLNLYCWSLVEYKDQLYLGTFDVSIMLKLAKDAGVPMTMPGVSDTLMNVVLAGAGADLWRTTDGTSWFPIELLGFNKDPYSYGVRNMVVYNNCLFAGLANPFYGAKVMKGVRIP